ncbi:uncharacterized protein LOC143769314 isoform X2 [Ranitomeya variabilis]|uniref:uncharacterized protein LOC143769314 isoform X2 n=1 Tax=Ranitomeya variabilis TaxID=490064 RepID=UPI00405760BA
MYESFIDCTGSDDDLPAVTTSNDEACAVQPLYSFIERDTWSPTFPTASTEETIIDLTGSDVETKDKENTSPVKRYKNQRKIRRKIYNTVNVLFITQPIVLEIYQPAVCTEKDSVQITLQNYF